MEDDYLQTGGKLLGMGVDGCVFMPPLLCKGDTKAPKGKLTGKLGLAEYIEPEYKVMKYITDTIPHADEYFKVLKGKKNPCSIAPIEDQPEKLTELETCFTESETVSLYDRRRLRLLTMSYGGEPLKAAGSISAKTDYWAFGRHLLEGATLLMAFGVVHADLHSNNVLVKDGLPIIFDFSNSYFVRTAKDIKERDLENLFHRKIVSLDDISSRNQHPPEVVLFNGLFNKYTISDDLESIFKERRPIINLMEIYLGVSKQDLIDQIQEYRRSTQYFEREPDIVKWWKHHWHTYDAYSVGYILLKLMLNMERVGIDLEEKYGVAKVRKMKEVLRGLLNFNCVKRLNAAQALAIWDEPKNNIIKKYAAKWL